MAPSLSPNTSTEVCIICDKPNAKSHPLRACATCRKLIHRRCTHTPTGSTNVYCIECLPEEQSKKETEKRKTERSTTNTLSRTSSTIKIKSRVGNTTKATSPSHSSHSSTASSRYSYNNKISPRYSNTTANNTEKRQSNTASSITNALNKQKNTTSSCSCLNNIQTDFTEWKKSIQTELQVFQDTMSTTIFKEVSAINKRLDSILYAISSKSNPSIPTTFSTSIGLNSSSTSHQSSSIIKPYYSNANIYKNVNTLDTNNTKQIHTHTDSKMTTLTHENNNILATHISNNDISTHTSIKNQVSQHDLNINFNNSINNNISNNNNYNLNNNNNKNLNSSQIESFKSRDGGNPENGLSQPLPTQYHHTELPSFSLPRPESLEIHIPGFMPLTMLDDLHSLSYSILQAFSPSLTMSEITNVRLLASDNTQLSETGNSSGVPRFPSFIIRLASSDLVKKIMSSKRKINYFSTRDLNTSQLSRELVSRMPY